MKKIENFGGWVVEHWLGFSCAAFFALALVILVMAPHGVRLSEKEFKCVEASPDGLGTRCDLYARRVK